METSVVATAGGSRAVTCPACGGALSDPLSGAVHCFRRCARCGAEFQLDDPQLL